MNLISRYPALRERAYALFFVGSLAAVGATQLLTFGQLWLVYELTESALMLGWLGAAMSLPNLAVTLLGGVIADRYDKRTILQVTSSGNMLLSGILVVLVLSGDIAVWHILLIAGISSLLNGFDWPTRVAIFPQLVERAALPSAVALHSFIWQLMRMTIPALTGFLLFAAGVGVVFAAAGIGYLMMCVTLLYLPLRPALSASSSVGAGAQILEGIGFILRNDIFKYLLLLTFVGMFFVNSHTQLMPMFASLNLTDEVGLGFLLAAGGVGSIVGTLVIGGMRQDGDLTYAMLLSGVLAGVATVGFTVASMFAWFYVALALQFFAACVGSMFLITSMTAMQLCVPDELRGRVMGIHTMCYSLLPLGGLFLGGVTDLTNIFIAVLVGASVYIVLLVGSLTLKSSLRHLRYATLQQIPRSVDLSIDQSAATSASISHETPVPPRPQ